MAINAYARSAADRMTMPVARLLVRAGATPNILTLTGLGLTVLGALVVLAGPVVLGASLAAVGTAIDALDGAVARLRGRSSRFGAFLDSVCDRIADAALFGAAAWLVRDDPLAFTAAIVALGSAQVTSYVRAKAESLDFTATVGIVERPERVMILITSLWFGLLVPALWLLAVGGTVTVVQRLRAVVTQAHEQDAW